MRKKVPISYSKERVVLSDVLPYETPVTFSNRYFYKYLLKHKKSETNSKFKAKYNKAYSEIEWILFNVKEKTTPFSFNITHKKNDFRELCVIHPSNQSKMVEFYDKYKELIIYHCSLSPFSIRRPSKVANFTFYNDILHKKNEDKDLQHSQIEQDDSEYENLKSFFSYRKYSNIHKFYESYQFHRSEKKYNKLLKIDVTKCFDSIYTHTISWAILNKNIVKTNIEFSLSTFGGEFDRLMQDLNANETNGIIIGPEFSRIFSELILQQIDIDIYENLKKADKNEKSLIHKIDYEIFRYVDDFFVFYNSESDLDRISETFKLSLKKYKMYLNDKKSIQYSKPIITEISIAKQKINDLFNNHLLLKKKDKQEDSEEIKPILYFSSNNVITRFKSIIKQSDVDYKDIMNYTLAVLDNKTDKLIKKYKKLEEEEDVSKKIQKEFETGFLEILDVTFFLYSVSPKVNSTIKVCLIIDKITSFLKKNKTNEYKEPFTSNAKHNILKKISDEINLILQKNKTKKETQIETLYLLIALSQLGREYRLNFKVLCSYLNIKINKDNSLHFQNELNYFSITVLLFYIRNIKIYDSILQELKKLILETYKICKITGWRDKTELVLLLMDILACPHLNNEVRDHFKNKVKDAKARKSKSLKLYIKELKDEKYKFKRELLSLLEINKNQILLIEQEKFWFTKWTDFDFGLELQAKRSQEVY
jgi:hypothetical protein